VGIETVSDARRPFFSSFRWRSKITTGAPTRATREGDGEARTFSSLELEARVRGRAETATRLAKMVAMVRAGSRGVARSDGCETSAVRGLYVYTWHFE
jgi:hypothetical protein